MTNGQFCYNPTEVWLNRIGYVAVLLNRKLTEAQLLGFVREVETEQLPLEQLQPLENLLNCLSQIQPVVKLPQWIKPIFRRF